MSDQANDAAFLVIIFMVLTFILIGMTYSLYTRITNFQTRVKAHPYRSVIFIVVFILLVLWWLRVMELV